MKQGKIYHLCRKVGDKYQQILQEVESLDFESRILRIHVAGEKKNSMVRFESGKSSPSPTVNVRLGEQEIEIQWKRQSGESP